MKYWPIAGWLFALVASMATSAITSYGYAEKYTSSLDTRIALTTPLREETRKQVNDHEGRIVKVETKVDYIGGDVVEIKKDVKEILKNQKESKR